LAKHERVTFSGSTGATLAGTLSTPDYGTPKGVALFAHCFTCSKNSAAASRISRTLADTGFAVLRFDFTGLGGSDGDFGSTGFASNVEDLAVAAKFLEQSIGSPTVLIGHSLGGTAVLAAAVALTDCRAVVTIGAPASPAHVMKHLGQSASSADVTSADSDVQMLTIGGREFAVQRGFIEGFDEPAVTEYLSRMKKALLIFHAPFDEIVNIEEAGKLFLAAKHPKSFVSLDGADHLLSRLEDAQYVAVTIAAWVSRYLDPLQTDRDLVPGGHVWVGEGNQRFLRDLSSDDHQWVADEPKAAGGDNLGPDPYEHLLAALGACTSMTLRMYANRKKLPLDDVRVELNHQRVHADDCESCEDREGQLDVIHRTISLQGELTDEQVNRLLQIADRCPVHRTLENAPIVKTVLG
jgi:putative redox protein